MTVAILTALQIPFFGVIYFCDIPKTLTTYAYSQTPLDITDNADFNI